MNSGCSGKIELSKDYLSRLNKKGMASYGCTLKDFVKFYIPFAKQRGIFTNVNSTNALSVLLANFP